MLNRYTIGVSGEKIKEIWDVDVPDTFRPTYNAGPTHVLPVITNQNTGLVSMFHWGLMAPLSNGKTLSPKLYSTKIETIENRVSFRNTIAKRKCIILCDGFYLWNKISKKRQVPYYLYASSREAFGVAGFWEEYEDMEHGQKNFAFNMVTVPCIDKLAKFSTDSLPAIVKKGKELSWLSEQEWSLNEYLDEQFHANLASHSVSPQIQDLSNDSIELIQNKPPADQLGNYTLFG